MKDICCIGHLTLDKIVTPRQTVYMPGGTSFYFSYGINQLPKTISYQLVTKLGEPEMKVVDKMRKAGIDVIAYPCNHTVFFENKYDIDQNNRKQRVLAKAAPFTIEDLKDIDAKVYHLGALLADDFSPELVEYLSTKGLISIDVQGYLRCVRNQQVYSIDWKEKKEVLKYTDIVKVNEHEMLVITGTDNPKEAARRLSKWGVKEVVVTLGSYGSLIYANGHFYKVPAYQPREVVDATGCGDTYSTGYLYSRMQGASYREAGEFAAAMCTMKLEHSGPFDRRIEDIEETIECHHVYSEEYIGYGSSMEM